MSINININIYIYIYKILFIGILVSVTQEKKIHTDQLYHVTTNYIKAKSNSDPHTILNFTFNNF